MASGRLLNYQRLFFRIKRKIANVLGLGNKQVYLKQRVGQYSDIWNAVAKDLGLQIEKLDFDLWRLISSDKKVFVRLHEMPLDHNITLKMCGRKPLVHRLLKAENLPVPDYLEFELEEIEKAQKFLDENPKGIVVKPCDGYSGLGVSTHIYNRKQLKKASFLASVYHDELMTETQIVGQNFRLLIYKGKMLHAVRRSGDWVTGDGQSTVAQLVQASKQPSLTDEDLLFTLSAQNFSLDSILDKDQSLLVRSVGAGFNGGKELRTIYDSDVTDLVHPEVQAIAEKCCEVVDAKLLGVDVITTDITKPLSETGGVINEVNTTPALHHHFVADSDAYPKVVYTIVKDLFS